MDVVFARSGLDRCAERREDHEGLARLGVQPGSRWLLMRPDGSVPVTATGTLPFVHGDRLGDIPDDWVFLGNRRDQPLFAATGSGEGPVAAPDPRWLDLRTAASSIDGEDAAILAYARGLLAWRARSRHCGVCGSRHRVEAGGHRLRCPSCDAVSFPRTDPAIIVAVRDGDRCLLGRQPGWPEGRYSTLAGFVEPGETLEGAVIREVREETGVQVDRCRYAASQPWPFPMSLMLAFEATASTTTLTIGEELEDANWFDPHDIELGIAEGSFVLPPRLSISRWLIERWHHDVTGRPLPSGVSGTRGSPSPGAGR